MSSVSAEKQVLIDAARAAGHKITSKQIDRWRLEKLLPEPAPAGRGRAGGVARIAPEETVPQLLALRACLRESRSFDRAAFRLWIDNFNIPLSRVRTALKNMATVSPAALSAMSKEQRAIVLADAEAEAAEARTAPKGVRSFARRGKLAPLVEQMVSGTTGDPSAWSEAERQSFARDFEEISGFDKGRVGAPELHVKPWIKGDISREMVEALKITREFPKVVDESSPEQFDRARRVYRSIEPLRQLIRFGNKAWGHCFGLETLLSGYGAKHPDALWFQSIMLLSNAKPEIEEVMLKIEGDAQKALAQIQEGLEAQRQSVITKNT
jgi:hypothetical protein